MTKVLQVMSTLDCGGAENMIMNLYRNIDRTKIQFDFVVHTSNKCFFEKEVNSLGGKIYRIPRYRLYNHFYYKKQWRTFFNEHPEYRIIHCHIRSVASIIIKIAKKRKISTICHSHSTSNGKGIKSIVKKIYQRKLKKDANYLFACSEESAVWLYGEKMAENKCIIMNNAIDVDKYKYNSLIREKIRKDLDIQDCFAIVQVGRFSEMKNHIFTLRIFQEYLKLNSNAKLFFVGDGELRKNIESIVNGKKLAKNVIFLGLRNDVYNILQAMDLFIMPSIFEGLPLSLIEAQASSIPCLISDNISSGVLNKKIVKKMSLNENANRWATELNKLSKLTRIDSSNIVKESGFDIKKNAKWLQKFYIDLEGGN